jgi:hypothetical protein
MASSTLTPYRDNTNQVTFNLVSQGADGATYKVSGRDLALPYAVEIQRKLSSGSSNANDRIKISVRRVERNVDTGKLATLMVSSEISIPKDTSTLDGTAQIEICAIHASLLNDATAMAATTANRTALIEGRDL